MKSNTYYFESPDIHVDNKTLLVNDNYYPIKNTESIYLFGQYEINSQLINLLNRENVVLHFGDFYGNYLGAYYPKSKKFNNKLILKQYEKYVENINKKIIETKMTKEYIKLIKSTLLYYERIGYIKIDKIKLNEVLNLTNPRKFTDEAICKKLYYDYIKKIINKKNWNFEKRDTSRNSQDPINNLISFVYSLIYKDTINSLYKQGFDPRISYIHAVNNRSATTLEYDISDHYKLLLGDRFIIQLILSERLTKDMFLENGYLKRERIKEVINMYNTFMEKKYKYNIGSLTGYQVIDKQVGIYKMHLLDNNKLKGIKIR